MRMQTVNIYDHDGIYLDTVHADIDKFPLMVIPAMAGFANGVAVIHREDGGSGKFAQTRKSYSVNSSLARDIVDSIDDDTIADTQGGA